MRFQEYNAAVWLMQLLKLMNDFLRSFLRGSGVVASLSTVMSCSASEAQLLGRRLM